VSGTKPSARLWVAVAALAFAATMAPIWWPRFLPLLDLPNHLGTIALWHRLSDPSWRYSNYYEYNRIPVPYWGYWYPTHLLAYLFSVETANKIYLTLYAAAVPASAYVFARRFNRDPRLALLTFPLVFNTNFGYGFISYCAGLPLVLFGLVVLDRQLAQPSARRLAVLFLVTVGTFALHVLPWMLFGVCAAVVLLARARPWRRGVSAALVLASTVPMAAFTFALSRRALPHGRQVFHPRLLGRFERLNELLREVPNRVVVTWPGWTDVAILVGLAAVWVAIYAANLAARRGTRAPRTAAAWVPELCFAVALGAYVFLPYRTYEPFDWWYVGPRLLTPTLLFGALLARGPIAGARTWLLAPLVALAIAYPLLLARQFRQFDERAQRFAHLMERVPRGSSTLVLLVPPMDDEAVDGFFVPYNDFHSYAQLLGGGYNPYREYFAFGFPVLSKPAARLPAPPFFEPMEFDQTRHGSYYDFVMTVHEPVDHFFFGDYASRVPLIGKSMPFRLYATRGIGASGGK
jgi:hypothetical protein